MRMCMHTHGVHTMMEETNETTNFQALFVTFL